MNKNEIFTLEDRGILYVHGEDCLEFLQNIITNDIFKVSENNTSFASLLTPQGKYLFDFLVFKHKSGFFLDCEKLQIKDLYKKLHLYKLRSKVEILNLSNEFVVAVISKEKFMEFPNSKNIPGFTIKFREDPIALDPRNTDLGARLIINLEKLYMSIKKLELKPTESHHYYSLSHKTGIPQLNTSMLQNKLFGIECNFDLLNGIDFKKGCYIGQENTARIKLKNKLSKRLLPIKVIEGQISENEKIINNGVEIGKILINDDYPFAIVKFLDKNFDKDKIFKSESGSFKIFIPEWLKI